MKAPRDFTRAQFDVALREHGFRKVLFWIEDTTGECPGVSWGIVMHGNGRDRGKIARRATLARVIRERDAKIAKRA